MVCGGQILDTSSLSLHSLYWADLTEKADVSVVSLLCLATVHPSPVAPALNMTSENSGKRLQIKSAALHS